MPSALGAPPPNRPASFSLTATEIVGNILFFVNCLATSLYVILSRAVLREFPSLCVTGWSYCAASILMVATCAAFNASTAAAHFVCPDCDSGGDGGGDNGGDDGDYAARWRVPTGALGALTYWIFAQVDMTCHIRIYHQ